jgi:hypothetical protein
VANASTISVAVAGVIANIIAITFTNVNTALLRGTYTGASAFF